MQRNTKGRRKRGARPSGASRVDSWLYIKRDVLGVRAIIRYSGAARCRQVEPIHPLSFSFFVEYSLNQIYRSEYRKRDSRRIVAMFKVRPRPFYSSYCQLIVSDDWFSHVDCGGWLLPDVGGRIVRIGEENGQEDDRLRPARESR